MKWRQWLENWDMTSLKINAAFLEMEWRPSELDKNAAWELYIELLTRITTQKLSKDHGSEIAALESVHSLFPTTRRILKENGRGCTEFTKIAVVVLNQKIRPFTEKWHSIHTENSLCKDKPCDEFKVDLELLQATLRKYTKMLADMANVEDMTSLEE